MKKFTYVLVIIISVAIGAIIMDYLRDEQEDPQINMMYEVPVSIKEHFSPKDNVYIINFFASWCNSCIKEHNNIRNIHDKFKTSIYGIAVNDTPDDLKAVIGKRLDPYKKVIFDFPMSTIDELKVDRIPRTIIVLNNEVVYDHIGELNDRILAKKIIPLLNKIYSQTDHTKD